MLNIPLSVQDITFERYIELKAEDKFFLEEPQAERILQFTKFFHGNDVPIGKVPKKTFMYKLGDEVTHMRTYFHLINLINSYEYEPVSTFEHDGKKWYVDSIINDRLNTNEYIIGMETERRLKEVEDTKGDPDGAFEFNLGLRLFACMARLENENIPLDKREREKWLDERMRIFANISMDKVLNVRGFFLSTIQDYAKTLTLFPTSKESQNTHGNKAQPTQERKPKIRSILKRFGDVLGITQ